MRRFEGRAAFVTGGGHGIGRAVALRLRDEGARVAVADIDLPAAEAVARELGGPAFAVHCDVTNTTSVDAAITEAVQRFGALQVLVNTAGGDFYEPGFEEISDDLWFRKIDLNLTGTVRCIRAALPALRASAPGSAVVSISSINGMAAFGGYPYSAAKAGLEILTKNLAAQYGPEGVRVNLISPGTIRTRNWDGHQDVLDAITPRYPLRRIGEPADIAAAVAFLASDDASWITGVNLPVEGGFLTGPLGNLPPLDDAGR